MCVCVYLRVWNIAQLQRWCVRGEKGCSSRASSAEAVFYAKWAVKSQFYALVFSGNWDNLNKMRRRLLYDSCVRTYMQQERSINLHCALHKIRRRLHKCAIFCKTLDVKEQTNRFLWKVLCARNLCVHTLCVQIGIIKKGTVRKYLSAFCASSWLGTFVGAHIGSENSARALTRD